MVERQELTRRGTRELLWDMVVGSISTEVRITREYASVETHVLARLRFMRFMNVNFFL